jgi:hypothetical protein
MAGYLAQLGADRAVELVHGAQPERLREQDRSEAPEQGSEPKAHGERPSALFFFADVLVVVFAITIAIATARTGARPGAAGTAAAAAGAAAASGGGARCLVRVLLLASLLGHIAFEFHLSVALHCGDPHLGQG